MCGSFPRGCGSQGVSRAKRDQSTWSFGKTMCGVPGGGDGVDYVDTYANVESCECFFLGNCVRGLSVGL